MQCADASAASAGLLVFSYTAKEYNSVLTIKPHSILAQCHTPKTCCVQPMRTACVSLHGGRSLHHTWSVGFNTVVRWEDESEVGVGYEMFQSIARFFFFTRGENAKSQRRNWSPSIVYCQRERSWIIFTTSLKVTHLIYCISLLFTVHWFCNIQLSLLLYVAGTQQTSIKLNNLWVLCSA